MARKLTLTQINQKVVRRLSMYPGTSVQLYAEDKIDDAIQSTFDMLFDDYWWPQYCGWYQWTLNETTGEVTDTLTSICKRWEDLKMVIPEDKNRPLPRLPINMNPYEISTTTEPRFIEPYNTNDKIFRVWPLEAEGTLRCYARTIPDTFLDATEIDFDSEALILGAAYKIAEDDGTNPGQTEKFQRLFNARVSQLKNNTEQMAFPIINLPNANIPTDWDGTGFIYGWKP